MDISKSTNFFQIFKPLYVLYSVLGISSIRFDGEKCIPVGYVQKGLCILVCTCTIFGISNSYDNLITNKNGVHLVKNVLDSASDIMAQLCVILVWIMSSFVTGKITVKMYLNFCKVERRLKIIQKWTPLVVPYLKIMFFHFLTLLIICIFNTSNIFVFEYSSYTVVAVTQIFICMLMIQKFCTEIYVIQLYVDKMTRELTEFLRRCAEELIEADNLRKSFEISNETNTLMQLYSKLSENCGISSNIIRFPVIY